LYFTNFPFQIIFNEMLTHAGACRSFVTANVLNHNIQIQIGVQECSCGRLYLQPGQRKNTHSHKIPTSAGMAGDQAEDFRPTTRADFYVNSVELKAKPNTGDGNILI
jgi:hypothetical protein